MTPSDLALIERVLRDDDRQAFALLVERHQSRLRYSLRQLTGYDEGFADDLAQETFIRAYNKLGQFRGEAGFYTWLYRIAWRCFADECRKRRPLPLDDTIPEPGYSHQSRDDLHLDLARALLRFEPERRMVLHLHFQREFTHREIAAITGCPLGTVKSHIQRGRRKLREYLRAWQT